MSQKHSEQYRLIGRAIQQCRREKGLTQEQLADQACISLSYLTKIEANGCDQPFSLEVLFDIQEVLGVSIHRLLQDID